MILPVICGLGAGLAWWIALAFIGIKGKKIVIDILGAALFGAVLCLALLLAFGPLTGLIGTLAAVFAGMSVIVSIQNGRQWNDTVLALFMAVGAICVILLAFGVPGRVTWISGAAGVMIFLIFAAAFRKLYHRFPEPGWRDAYEDAPGPPGRLNLKLSHVYGIVAAAGLATGALWAVSIIFYRESEIIRIFMAAAGAAVFWLGIFCVILMITCKKERVTILAEQQYREEMENFMNVIRSQRHDYNFHVQTIAGLIHGGKIKECVDYVDALERDAAAMNAVLPIKDAAISALIHNFQILAGREGIRLYIDIQNDLSQISTNVYETNKIISNLLQNALDETMTHTDKSYGIHLSVLKRGEYCVIRVSNAVQKKMDDPSMLGRIYQQGYSTKQGHDGVGLSSIKTLAARYGGMIYTQVEDQVIHFVARIPINYANGGESDEETFHAGADH